MYTFVSNSIEKPLLNIGDTIDVDCTLVLGRIEIKHVIRFIVSAIYLRQKNSYDYYGYTYTITAVADSSVQYVVTEEDLKKSNPLRTVNR